MVEELAQERHAGRLRGVVRVVGAQRQVDDQLLRPCRERVVRIEKPTRLAELDQRSVDPSARDLAQVSVVSSEEHVTGEEYAEAPSPDKGGR
jgi:hypothetical protein